MMIFGASGSQYSDRRGREVIATSNRLRANMIAELVASGRAVIRTTYRTRSGGLETYAFPNPLIKSVVYHRFAYPAEVRATLQALQDLLRSSSELRTAAEMDGITEDAIEETIEQVLQSGERRRSEIEGDDLPCRQLEEPGVSC